MGAKISNFCSHFLSLCEKRSSEVRVVDLVQVAVFGGKDDMAIAIVGGIVGGDVDYVAKSGEQGRADGALRRIRIIVEITAGREGYDMTIAGIGRIEGGHVDQGLRELVDEGGGGVGLVGG